MHFRKLPQVISYRGFKKYENERFMNSLQSALKSQDNDHVKNPHLFFKVGQKVLNQDHAPRKKYIRRNNKPINQRFSRRFSSFYF